MATDKQPTPAYGSFKSLTTFFNARRDDPHDTDVVDRSLMINFSGSTANELMACLKFLKMISDKGEPLPLYRAYVKASDEARQGLLADALRAAYPFIFNNAAYNLERATTATTADVFRTQGINGSTLSRAISFFLAAAKAAGIKVSTNIKAPPLSKSAPKPKKAAAGLEQTDADDIDDQPDDDPEAQVFEIPIPIDRKVKIVIPAEWEADDWDLFQTMLTAYITGWKKLAQQKANKTEG